MITCRRRRDRRPFGALVLVTLGALATMVRPPVVVAWQAVDGSMAPDATGFEVPSVPQDPLYPSLPGDFVSPESSAARSTPESSDVPSRNGASRNVPRTPVMLPVETWDQSVEKLAPAKGGTPDSTSTDDAMARNVAIVLIVILVAAVTTVAAVGLRRE